MENIDNPFHYKLRPSSFSLPSSLWMNMLVVMSLRISFSGLIIGWLSIDKDLAIRLKDQGLMGQKTGDTSK
jgi:hypothetical protein